MAFTAELNDKYSKESKGRRCLGPRFTSVLESVPGFSSIVDTFINASQMQLAGAVWGVVRVALKVCRSLKMLKLYLVTQQSQPEYGYREVNERCHQLDCRWIWYLLLACIRALPGHWSDLSPIPRFWKLVSTLGEFAKSTLRLLHCHCGPL